MSYEVVEVLHGTRGGVRGYRICQKCKSKPVSHAIVYKRRWWQLAPKTVLVCEDCRPQFRSTFSVAY